MKKVISILFLFALILSASADSVKNSVVGIGGYDPVSYHTAKRPQRGTGSFAIMHAGVNYLFASENNMKLFKENPEKYLPAYGGYCAFGVAVGKKFISDPEVWDIIEGRLYLNLDNKIKGMWVKDIKGYIQKADANWKKIKDVKPDKL